MRARAVTIALAVVLLGGCATTAPSPARPAPGSAVTRSVPAVSAPAPSKLRLPEARVGATQTPSPSTAANVLPNLPPTPDFAVPADLQPSLLQARQDYPPTFADHCNVAEGGTASLGTCLYADLSSKTTIALFGDSHAAFWFPAVEGFAQRQGWRMLNLTMSSCTPADLTVYNSIFKRIYSECSAWREVAIERLIAIRPAVVLVTGTHGISPVDASGQPLTGDALTQAWQAGMARTLDRLVSNVGLLILLADTPVSRLDPPSCLSAHVSSVLACATPVGQAIDQPWLTAEHEVVAQTGVGFIDPTFWVCPTNPCPVVIGNLLVYQNAGHLTATFAAALTDRFGAAVLQEVRAHGGLR